MSAGTLAQGTNGFGFVNGTKLGFAAPASNSGGVNILFSTAPTAAFVGSTTQTSAGINNSQLNTAIIPYLVGESSATQGTVTGIPNTFVTYDTTTGLRPLATTEFTGANLIAVAQAATISGSRCRNTAANAPSASIR